MLYPLEPPPSPRRDLLNLALAILLAVVGASLGGFASWLAQ